MKRFLAAAMVLLCLLLLCPAVLAQQVTQEEDLTAQTETDTGEETAEGEAEEETTEETSDETGEETEEETEEEAPPVDPLIAETAIRKMHVQVTVDEHGKATVRQTMELSILGSLEEIRFAVPETAKGTEIEDYRAKSEKEDGFRWLTISSKSGFSGNMTFELAYTQNGLVKEEEASQVLTLPLLSTQDYRIGSLSFSVTLPEPFAGTPRFSSGYYKNLVEELMTVTTSGGVTTGVVDQILQDSEVLTMTLALPEGYFEGNYAESNLTPFLTVVIFLLAALVLLYWWQTLRNNSLRVQARTLPPDGVNPGDVPYLLAGGDADFNMLVSHWAVLGYLSFFVSKSGHVILRRRMSMGNERRAFERRLFDLLFGEGDVCDGASVRYKKVGEKAMAVIPRYWAKRLYHKRSGSPLLARGLCCIICALATLLAMDAVAPDKGHGFFLLAAVVAGVALAWLIFRACGAYYLNDWRWTSVGIGSGLLLLIIGGLGGATLTMVPSVALAVFIGWQTAHGGRRKPYGDEVIGQTLGFRRFLHNASDHHLMQMLRRDPQYFYKILPYAEAMGQGRHFVSLFHDCRLEPCQWYEAANGTPVTAEAFYDHYCETLAMLNVSIRK